CFGGRARDGEEACGVVVAVLDVGGEDVEAVAVGGRARRDRGLGGIARGRDFLGAAGGVVRGGWSDVRVRGGGAAALRECYGVRSRVAQRVDVRAGRRHQEVPNR